MSGPLRLRHRVLERVRRHQLWAAGQRVCVAVSGGRDSMVLLDVLVQTARVHQGRIEVLTVDHGVRPGSGDDARWVLAQAERLGVPARAVRLPEGPDDEARLREGRRAAWAPVIDAGGVVATGHHRRDQAETVLLQLLRGGGGAARQGMRWSHGGVVRPLLDTSEEALTAYAEARGLSWRDDPSNREPRYLRNRVRHELLPLLEALRPGAVGALARSAALAADDEALLEQLAGDALHTWRRGDGLEAHWVATGPASLVRRALRSLWPSLDGAKLDAVRALARGRGGPVSLDADRQLVAVDGVLRLRG